MNLWYILLILVLALFAFGGYTYWHFPKKYNKRCEGHLALKKDECENPLESQMDSARFYHLYTPLLTIFAICLTFSAFFIQFDANRIQNKQHEHEYVERLVYEFINMHTAQVNNMHATDKLSGNRAFHYMYYEFLAIREVLEDILISKPEWNTVEKDEYEKPKIDETDGKPKLNEKFSEDVTRIAFKAFYYGVSQEFDFTLLSELSQPDSRLAAHLGPDIYSELNTVFRDTIICLQKLNETRVFFTDATVDDKEKALKSKEELKGVLKHMNEYILSDQVFIFANGHIPELNSHMRLIHTILMSLDLMNIPDKKKEILYNLIRSQISSHEMYMIFLYSLCQNDLYEIDKKGNKKDWFEIGYLHSDNGVKINLLRDINLGILTPLIPNAATYLGKEDQIRDMIDGENNKVQIAE